MKNLPALARLIEDVKTAAKRGYLIGIDGRHIYVRSEHSALNTLLQSSGALLMKQAGIILHEDMASRGYVWRKDWGQVAFIHDEYLLETKPEIADEVGLIVSTAMTKAGEHFKFRCKIEGAFKKGERWHLTH